MDERLHARVQVAVFTELIDLVDPETTVGAVTDAARAATIGAMEAVADRMRGLDTLTVPEAPEDPLVRLEDVLFVLGYRP